MIRVLAFMLLLMLPGGAYAQCTPPSDGLVGHWKMDETSGTSAADSSGNGNTGTMEGSMDATNDSVTGTIVNGLDFDSTDDAINVAGSATLDDLGPRTLAAWIKPRSVGEGGFGRIFQKSGQSHKHWAINLGATNKFGYTHGWGGSPSFFASWEAPNSSITMDEWQHVAVTYDPSSTANDPVFYVNGVKVLTTEITAPSGSTASNAGDILYIGNRSTNDRTFDGAMDDVRVYNRILSADEIAALYATRSTADAPAGFLTYDVRHARYMYCNGTNWVHAGIGSYNPNAVTLVDGATNYLSRGGTLSGVSDGKVVSGSVWFRTTQPPANPGGGQELFVSTISAASNGAFGVVLDDAAHFVIYGRNGANTSVMNLAATGAALNDGNWHHALFSIDLTDTNKRHIYIDGVADLSVTTWDNTQGDINFVDLDHYVGRGKTTATDSQFNGDLADLWIDFGTYIDFSVEANRRKFINASGMPKYLGKDGSLPTGSAPDIFLSGATDTWHTNFGTGGGFTENGALTTSGSQPGDGKVPATGDITANLKGYWKLDEGTGTNAADASGNGHDATLVSSPAWIDGKAGSALQFNSVSQNYVDIPDHADFTGTTFSVSAWVYATHWNAADQQNIVSQYDQGGMPNIERKWLMKVETDGKQSAHFTDSQCDTFGGNTATTADTIPLNQWLHFVGVWTPAAVSLYRNGVQVAQDSTGTSRCTDVAAALRIGMRQDTGDPSDLVVDDVRYYDRALSVDDIKLLYNCAAPKGAMKYDSSYNVMSYCNGVEWVAMGPVGGTPPTSGLVGHWAMNDTSGTTVVDSVGGLNGTWVGGGVDDDVAPGVLGTALDFNGSSEWINLPANSLAQNRSAFTMALWMKTDQLSSASAYSQLFGLSEDVGGAGGSRTYIAYGATDQIHVGAEAPDGSGFTVGTDMTLAAGIWYHVVGVVDIANDSIKVYINGSEVSTTGASTFPGTATSDTVSDNGVIGSEEDDAGYGDFDGKLDDVRFYNRALSAQEVAQLYYYGLSGGLGDVSGNCANPSMPEGSMVYNIDHSYMQYCNGERWVGIGK